MDIHFLDIVADPWVKFEALADSIVEAYVVCVDI